MKPTKIVKKPFRKRIPYDDTRSFMRTFCTCDDGKTYDVRALAKLIGFTHHRGFVARLKKVSWQDDNILAPPMTERKHTDTSTNRGNAEWKALGKKPRPNNPPEPYEFMTLTIPTRQPNGDALK